MPPDLFDKKTTAEVKHSEDSVTKILRNHFNQGYTYRINNAFIYAHDWECDFFCVNSDGYALEFEIKISRGDFQNDFLKFKHLLFKKTDKKGILMPNRFYYVVPEGMVSTEEIPKYAGLIYITGQHMKIVKRAPFIHKEKRDYRKVLCDKFYERYTSQRREFAQLIYDMKNARKLFEKMQGYLTEQERSDLRLMGFLK